MHKLRVLLLTFMLVLAALVTPVLAQGYNCGSQTTALAHNNEGDRLYNAGDYETAIDAYTCALELNSADAYAFEWRGNAYAALGDYDQAIEDLTRALEHNPADASTVYNSRGLAYYDTFRYEEAAQDFAEGLTFSPQASYLINNQGIVYYVQGDYETAIEYFDSAINLEVNDYRYIPYYNRGISYYELGDLTKAEADLNEALALNGTYADAYLVLGNLYNQIGSDQAAENHIGWIENIQLQLFRDPLNDAPTTYTMTYGHSYYFTVELSAGQNIDIAARSESSRGDADPLLVLLDPQGNALVSDDDSGVNLDAVIANFEVPETGTYTVVMSHAGGGSEGLVTLTVSVDGSVAESFPIYQLIVGGKASVYTTGGDRLNLRTGPGLNFEIASRLEKGTDVTLLEGPRKADGYAWWLIRTADGVEGWSVERVETEQTLQPFMAIGGKARINTTAGDKLNVRVDAGTNFDLATQLVPGTIVTLIDGPIDSGTYVWWKIRTEDGVEGWAVERAGEEHTLIGLPPEADSE